MPRTPALYAVVPRRKTGSRAPGGPTEHSVLLVHHLSWQNCCGIYGKERCKGPSSHFLPQTRRSASRTPIRESAQCAHSGPESGPMPPGASTAPASSARSQTAATVSAQSVGPWHERRSDTGPERVLRGRHSGSDSPTDADARVRPRPPGAAPRARTRPGERGEGRPRRRGRSPRRDP